MVPRKISYDNLAIEITRRCNMNCAHCLRGDAQNKDISREVIDQILDGTNEIWSLSITGGEISLNVDALNYLADEIKRRNIYVGSVYMVTNGKVVSDDFLLAMTRLFSLSDNADGLDSICLSQDDFHEEIPEENIRNLRMFAAFNEDDHWADFSRGALLNLGRAKDLTGYKKREKTYSDLFDEWEVWDDKIRVLDTVITVTCDGDVVPDCDYAYADVESIRIGNVSDPLWMEKYVQKKWALASCASA